MLTGPGGRWVEQWQWQQKDIYPQSSWSSDADRGSDADCEAGSAECFYPFFDVSSRHIALLVSVCVCVCACVAVCLCQDITRFRFSFTTFCYYFVFCSTPVMYFFQFAGVFFLLHVQEKNKLLLGFFMSECVYVCVFVTAAFPSSTSWVSFSRAPFRCCFPQLLLLLTRTTNMAISRRSSLPLCLFSFFHQSPALPQSQSRPASQPQSASQ